MYIVTEGPLLPSQPDQLNIAPLTSSKLGTWQPGGSIFVEVGGGIVALKRWPVKQKNDMRRCDGLGLLGQPYSTG